MARIEWQTVALALVIYAAFAGVTWFYSEIPWWLFAPLAAIIVCMQGSLQHEAIHGHPTPWQRINAALAMPSLSLWIPYEIYRRQHLIHHRTDALTSPTRDPESFYVTAERWSELGLPLRALLIFNTTLAGRLTVGPAIVMAQFFAAQLRLLAKGDRFLWRAWGRHVLVMIPLIYWITAVCEIPFLVYVALAAYPGLSLTLLRSFAEHRPEDGRMRSSVLIEAAWPFRLLFLGNNYHALHHAQPTVPWYRLHGLYRLHRDRLRRANGGYAFDGYGDLAAKYLLRPLHVPSHPDG
ncbi:MAG: fatty acid desaturase [Alphaproteobacteria bacterium]|nr:fatty acid desaturase [Alphaproteobacteria bacterium]